MNNPLRYTDPSGEFVEFLIAGAFYYLKGAHDNRDKTTGKWAWNPVNWFGKDQTGFVVGVNSNTDFTNVNYYAGLYSPDNSPVLAYNPDYGMGMGNAVTPGSNTFYYPSYNFGAARQTADRFVAKANAPSSGDGMNFADKGNYLIGIGATLGEYSGITYRLLKGGNFNPKLYYSGWRGGSRASIKTFSLSKTARGIGGAAIVAGGVIDGMGVLSYYMNGPEHPLSVHPGKAGLNLGIGVYSFYLNPFVGGVYFGVDLFYPEGWHGYMDDTDRIIQMNQEILGPGWHMFR